DAPVIVKADEDAQAIIRLAVTSDTMSIEDMSVYVEDEIVDRFAAVPGVADVQVYGGREKIFRIDIDQARLASYGLTVGDIGTALSSIAFDSPAGSLTNSTQKLIVSAPASSPTPEDFERMLLAENVRVAAVATVILGPDEGESRLRTNGWTGTGVGIERQTQSNTLDISAGGQK